MVDLATVHSMLVEMHGGMITLAAACVLATLVARFHFRARQTNESYGLFWPADSFLGSLGRYAEPTAFLAAIGGVIGLIGAALVGFYVWPMDFITQSNLAMSKVTFSVFATVLLCVFVFTRAKYGDNLWKSKGRTAIYALSGIIGFLFMVVAGSLGGHMALKGSVLDPLFSLVGVNPENLVTASSAPMVLLGVSVLEVVVPAGALWYLQRKSQLKASASP